MEGHQIRALRDVVECAKKQGSPQHLLSAKTRSELGWLEASSDGLSYGHLYHLTDFECEASLAETDVLEIGGAISEEFVLGALRVNSWTAVQKEYISSDLNRGNNTHDSSFSARYRSIEHAYGLTGAFKAGFVKEDSVDRVFSLACFEHVHDLSETLEVAYKCLRANGVLYSYFSPIWSSESSHLPVPHSSLEVPYYHLMHDFSSMYLRLISLGVGDEKAYSHALEHYKCDSLNRYSYEDYELIFNKSRFEVKSVIPINKRPLSSLDPATREKIQRLYPRIKTLATGFRVVLKKVALTRADTAL